MTSYRKTPANKMIGLLMVSMLVALTCACTHVSSLKATVDRPPNVVQVPLVVGVYYSPEFHAYKHVRTRQTHRWVVPVGQASVSLFDRIMPMIFANVVPVPSRPPLSATEQSVAAVIEPRIEQFDFVFPWVFGTYTAEITYRFMLYSPDGTPLASWTVNGRGERDWRRDDLTHTKPIGDASNLAMKDAAIKFMTGFRDIPHVRQWLQSIGVQDDK
jgi:hypothetical protein